MADKIIHDYRKRCLECGVMDFAIALDLYTNVLLKNSEYIAILKNKIKYILVDNLEEAVPAQIDFLKNMRKVVDNMLLVYNNEGGYGSIFGANRQYVEEELLNNFEIENLNNLLKFIGYDADSIHINFYLCHGSPGWSILIRLLYHDDRGYKHDRIEFYNTILDEKSKSSDIIKILKDVTKDIKTFQKFLENMKSYKVDASNIIKVI
jgi:hypothetical protein